MQICFGLQVEDVSYFPGAPVGMQLPLMMDSQFPGAWWPSTGLIQGVQPPAPLMNHLFKDA